MDFIKSFTESYQPFSYLKRIENLKRLNTTVKKYEKELLGAINNDLNRSDYETLLSEIFPFYKEINYFLKHLKKLMKPKKAKGMMATFGAKTYTEKKPYGVVLIISPWNYPFGLSFIPIVGAIAAGNKVILKSSEISVHTAKLFTKIFSSLQDFMLIVEGGVEVSTEILHMEIDYVFFTGSTNVGKLIMKECIDRLIPHTLELGGKSPCIIEKSSDLTVAAKRILWGKLLNAGQTCIAPDYILVNEGMKDAFIKVLVEEAKKAVLQKEKMGKIINGKHYERLKALISKERDFLFQDKSDQQQTIGLTILMADRDSELMKQEIFGPILPIMTYKDCKNAVMLVKHICKNPLALYVFTNEKEDVEFYSENILSGGMCVNDVLMQFNNHHLPFGGVGQSGVGQYHGEYSFNTFTHLRGVLANKNSLRFDVRHHLNDAKVLSMRKILTK